MHIDQFEKRYSQTAALTKETWAQIALLLKLERDMFAIIASQAIAIGLFSLGVPLAVQELVSTFSFAVEARMVFTLAAIVAGTLVLIAAFRVLQARAVETLLQRIYTRIALGFTATLPRLHEDTFLPQYANRFLEAELVTRALVAMVADLFNVITVGAIGMTLLVFYHPYFLVFNFILVAGFVIFLTVFGYGGFLITLEVSRLNYATFNWIQNIAHNLPHLRATADSPYLLQKTDELLLPYVKARQIRSDRLSGHQYKAAVMWQAVAHTALITTAGLLVAGGQLTVGQFVAAEVVVGNLLVNMDTLARRMYAMFYVFTSLREMAGFFLLPKVDDSRKAQFALADLASGGMKVSAKNLSFAYPHSHPLFHAFDLEVSPSEKVAVLCQSNTAKTALAKILAGLSSPTTGVVRYNDMNLLDVNADSLNACRGLVLDSHPTLLDGTLVENITLGRPSITFEDIQWALRFVELEEEVEAMPDGLKTVIEGHGKVFTLSQILRVLVARAVVTRPYVLIFDGTLHSMLPATREIILRRLCAKEEPWTVIFLSNDPSFTHFVDRIVILD